MIHSHRTIHSLYQAAKLACSQLWELDEESGRFRSVVLDWSHTVSLETLMEVKKLAHKFVKENYKFPSTVDYLLIENAMMIAVLHVTGVETESIRALNQADVESKHEDSQLPIRS
jgi:hypothetical protein